VPFMYSGHGSFYDERDKFNELMREFVGTAPR
jgi:non-heme chloroperoxidase